MANNLFATAALLCCGVAFQASALHQRTSRVVTSDDVIGHHPVKLPEDPWSETYRPRGDVTKPRMLAMRGCSGSSAIMIYARSLLKLHGIPVPPAADPPVLVEGIPQHPMGEGWPAELLSPKINFHYDEAGKDIGKAMTMCFKELEGKNQTLFFKGMVQYLQGTGVGRDAWHDLKNSFKDMNILGVVGSRKNMLDQVICQVKDCFQDDYGIPVDGDGKESTLCFDRRGGAIESPVAIHSALAATERQRLFYEDDGYKAKLNVDQLVKSIKHEFEFVHMAKRHLTHIGTGAKIVYEEDLLDFQAPIPGAFERAQDAWAKLLESLGVEPKKRMIKAFLEQYAGTYHTPPSHPEIIYNHDEVKAALTKTEFADMWRE